MFQDSKTCLTHFNDSLQKYLIVNIIFKKLYTNSEFNASWTKDKRLFFNEAKKSGKKFTKKQIENFWLTNPYLATKSGAPRRRYKKKVIFCSTIFFNDDFF